MLLLDQRTLQIKYRIPATEIYRLSLSPYHDNIAVFHVKAVRTTLKYELILPILTLKFVFIILVGNRKKKRRFCFSNCTCY